MQVNAFNVSTYTYDISNKKDSKESDAKEINKNETELSPEEKTQVAKLKSIDAEVRAHEMAHVSAGGGLTGAVTYSYTKGPDNKMYAIAGEVSISMKEGRTPQESIAIARQIQAAAMAPSDPSPQDYKVAASAMQMEIKARADLLKEEAKEKSQEKEDKTKENLSIQDRNKAYNSFNKDETLNFSMVI